MNTNNETLPFAALTVEQATQIISGLISQELRNYQPKAPEHPKSDLVNISGAANFLNEIGYITTKNSLYNLVCSRSIPFRKIGRRVVFSCLELKKWVEDKIEANDAESATADNALAIARSARRKK